MQGHLDMVNEKNSDVDHDFDKDPLVPQMDGEYLKATGTTLGSDNGIGLAAMLAVMEAKDLEHGPLEFLFTIDEETGLTGAATLGEDMLEARRLLNLDSEEEGVLTIGCAGGGDTHLALPLARTAARAGAAALRDQGLRAQGRPLRDRHPPAAGQRGQAPRPGAARRRAGAAAAARLDPGRRQAQRHPAGGHRAGGGPRRSGRSATR